jgi:paraquat-inducible protein A
MVPGAEQASSMENDQPAIAIACKICGRVHALVPLPPGTLARCVRCGSVIARRTTRSLHYTAAFALAALLLYVPANTLPILRLELYGATSDNTAWDGAVRLVRDGDYVIATIVFMASILVPLLKLIGLFFVVATTRFHLSRGKLLRTCVFRFIESIGRWAMLDVFVVAILVSLVKLQGLATVIPGRGLLAFGGVVVFTLLASASFDPQLIWEDEEQAS